MVWTTHGRAAYHDVIGDLQHQPPVAVAVLQHVAGVQGARAEQGLRLGLELRPVVYVRHCGATAAAASPAAAAGVPAISALAPAHDARGSDDSRLESCGCCGSASDPQAGRCAGKMEVCDAAGAAAASAAR